MVPLEDLLVALADSVWNRQWLKVPETRVVCQIGGQTGVEQWGVSERLDGLLEELTAHGDGRLACRRGG